MEASRKIIQEKIKLRLGLPKDMELTDEWRRDYLLELDQTAKRANFGVHGGYLGEENEGRSYDDSRNLILSAMADD